MADTIAKKVEKFFTAYPQRVFDKGQLLAHAEESLTGVFYVREGRVSQYDITPTGNEVVVNVFKSGAFFPMSWAMNATPNHYFFEASTKVIANEAPAAAAVDFVKANPDVLFDLLARVYRGTDGMLRRMAHLMGGDAKTRLLFELLNAASRFGEPHEGGHILIPLKESELGRYSGLARETVNRTMQSFKSAGYVEVRRGGVILKNIKDIERVLGEDL